jgi:hypothetical protein
LIAVSGANISTRLVARRGPALQLTELSVDLALHLPLPSLLFLALSRKKPV